jgi:hypothetical protein
MDLFAIDNISVFSLPTATSVVMTIRQQLWAMIDRLDLDLAITQLATPDLIHCRRIDGQPLTYLSALPHQLLQNPALSPSLGHYLLAQLTATSHSDATAQWQGAVNDQGYLYLQPTEKAIGLWINHLLSCQNLEIITSSCPVPTASSITLEYIYTRCTQLIHLAGKSAATCRLEPDELVAMMATDQELIGAVLDLWDVISPVIVKSASIDRVSSAPADRRLVFLSYCLVEKFLEFEKDCCFGSLRNQIRTSYCCCLVAVVQITVRIVLQQYWGLTPDRSW